MNEQKLIEKLRLIEALFSGTTSPGEKVAAELAKERIFERLRQMEKEEPLIEYRFTMADMWSRKVFVALLRRYGINPYRYHGQRYTTVMARVSKRFVDETLWPEFNEISETLKTYLSEITERVVSQVIHQDSSEAEVVKEPALLTPDTGFAPADSQITPSPAVQPDHNKGVSNKPGQTAPPGSRGIKKKRKGRKKRR
jgi:hypothetical protein